MSRPPEVRLPCASYCISSASAGVLLQFIADDRDHDGRAHRRRAGTRNAPGVAGHVALGFGRYVDVACEGIDDIVEARLASTLFFSTLTIAVTPTAAVPEAAMVAASPKKS